MEFVRPARDWEDFHSSPAARELFQKFRTRDVGEQLLLHDNAFIEGLARTVIRKLTAQEMGVYRAPFSNAAVPPPGLAVSPEDP